MHYTTLHCDTIQCNTIPAAPGGTRGRAARRTSPTARARTRCSPSRRLCRQWAWCLRAPGRVRGLWEKRSEMMRGCPRLIRNRPRLIGNCPSLVSATFNGRAWRRSRPKRVCAPSRHTTGRAPVIGWRVPAFGWIGLVGAIVKPAGAPKSAEACACAISARQRPRTQCRLGTEMAQFS